MVVQITFRVHAASAALFAAFASVAVGQRPEAAARPAQPVFSMGQPLRWQPYAVASHLFDRSGEPSFGSAVFGIYHPVLNPVNGLFGVSGEGYATAGGAYVGGGARVLASAPAIGLSVGIDWNVGAGRLDYLMSFQTAIRRGGVVDHGSMVRVDWMPTRSRTIGVGLQVPLMQPFAGRTRTRETAVRLPSNASSAPLAGSALTPALDSALAIVADAAARIRLFTSVWSGDDERELGAVANGSGGRRGAPLSYDYAATLARYHKTLIDAFRLAAGGAEAGSAIARRALAGLLDSVIVPFDSLFGRLKEPAGDIRGLTRAAQASFVRWLRDSSHVAAAVQPMVSAVHARWLEAIERVHRDGFARWKDSRLVWLPFQLALTDEQYDDQAEVDSLVARLVGRPFTDENALTYLRSSDLPLEIARSIYATRDYHVLWTHDFTGRRESGDIDNIGYSMVADAYYPALTAAVKRYDSTASFPVYMILVDEYFYEPRDGRLWMTILEDPMHASVRLPGTNPEREAHLRQRQDELRAAVAGSVRLQREAASAGGESWLRRVVKVHVSVTQPSDFSFRSHRTVPPIPFTPDNVMRDHRKVAIYDLNEADPYRGAMILMGVGVGEHYASATWEDRGYRVRGPAALEVRAALRETLRANGFRDADIPPPLRVVEGAPADSTTERQMNRGDYAGRALQIHNEVGFARKESSAARALLYTLTPATSVVIAPDPLWLSSTWASMLAGAAARGCRVFAIAPARENAPSPQAPLMALQHDVLVRLLELQQHLGDVMKRAGGELRVGLFAARAGVNDAQGRVREVRAGLQRAPWIREVIPFDAKTLAVLERAAMQTASDGADATSLAHDEKPRPPQLHQKTQLIARPGAIAALVRQPGWDDVLAATMRVQSEQTREFAKQLGWETPDVDTAATRRTDAMLRGFEQSLPEAERRRVSFYFSLGTQNQDPRGVMFDAETTLLVSGFHASAGLVDLYYLMARSNWVATQAELEQYLPRPSGFLRRLAKAVKFAL